MSFFTSMKEDMEDMLWKKNSPKSQKCPGHEKQ